MTAIDWSQALCAQVDPDLWFPEKGHSGKPAQRICMRCPIRVPCAELGAGEVHGVWGGRAARERRDERKDAA